MDASGFELGTDGPLSILVGIDGSDTSMRAAAYAGGLARRQGAHLLALYVMPIAAVATQLAASAGAMLETQDELGRELRELVTVGARTNGISAEFVQRTGNPYRELITLATQRRVDAVVVGASMQSGHKLIGSLAGRLVRDALWPITVVP